MRKTSKPKRIADATKSTAPTAPVVSGAQTNRDYLRPAHVVEEYPMSRRTLSNLMRRKVLPYHKVGRLVLFRRTDIEAALDRFRVRAVGE